MTQKKTIGTNSLNRLHVTDLADLVGYQVKRAHMRVLGDFRATMAPFDLTQRTLSVLSLVCCNPDVSQSAVSRELGIERSGTVVIVDQLEDRGLLNRNRVARDRRAYALRATDAGTTLYASALQAVRDHEARLLSRLDTGEIDSLRALLGRVAT